MKRAFTIVELLVTIVVIGIIASIAYVSFVQVGNEAQEKALELDLRDVAHQVEKERAESGALPADLSGFSLPGDRVYGYSVVSTTEFCISSANQGVTFFVTSSSSDIAEGTCP